MKKILLLGATGFVGRNVSEAFRENKIQFSIAARSNGYDLRSLEQCEKLFQKEKPDYIINCAAHVGSLNYVTQQAADVITDNLKIVLSIYEAAAKNCPDTTIINPIANCAYPAHAETYKEDELWSGQTHRTVLSYGSARRAMLAVADCYNMQYGLRSINLIVPNMYGPFDSTDPDKAHALNALVSKFVKAEKTGQCSIDIWGTGAAIREWLYAKDFGRILAEILNNPNMVGLSEPVNIAQNFGLSIKELIGIITKHFNYGGQIIYDSNKPDGALKKVMDDTKFKKVFPDFKFTSLNNGIIQTIKYYESIYPY
ncbi:MAG: NAD-dependent epimerase/dehydratase family protein [Candidatus Falkowbacteria bacterium]